MTDIAPETDVADSPVRYGLLSGCLMAPVLCGYWFWDAPFWFVLVAAPWLVATAVLVQETK